MFLLKILQKDAQSTSQFSQTEHPSTPDSLAQ